MRTQLRLWGLRTESRLPPLNSEHMFPMSFCQGARPCSQSPGHSPTQGPHCCLSDRQTAEKPGAGRGGVVPTPQFLLRHLECTIEVQLQPSQWASPSGDPSLPSQGASKVCLHTPVPTFKVRASGQGQCRRRISLVSPKHQVKGTQKEESIDEKLGTEEQKDKE